MGWSWVIVGYAFWGILVGGLTAIAPGILLPVPLLVWLLMVIDRAHAKPAGQRWREGLVMLSIQGIAITLAITVAVLAPVKTQDRLMKKSVTLPKTEMSLEELELLTHNEQLQWPTFVHVNYPDAEASRLVSWPAKDLTMREFVTAIEEQTPLRHRFRFCGVAMTILWGPDDALLDMNVPVEEQPRQNSVDGIK